MRDVKASSAPVRSWNQRRVATADLTVVGNRHRATRRRCRRPAALACVITQVNTRRHLSRGSPRSRVSCTIPNAVLSTHGAGIRSVPAPRSDEAAARATNTNRGEPAAPNGRASA